MELNTLSTEKEVTEARADYNSLHRGNFYSEDYKEVIAGCSKEPVTEAPNEPEPSGEATSPAHCFGFFYFFFFFPQKM